jgi:hypothetical protein
MRNCLIVIGLAFLSSFATASDMEDMSITARRLAAEIAHINQINIDREFTQNLHYVMVVQKPSLRDYEIIVDGIWVEKTDERIDDEKSDETS